MKKKPILVLQRVNFCFQNTWQSKDCIFRITCVGSLKKSLIFKRSFQKSTSLISFQQTRLWIDMIFEVWELIPEQKDCQTRRISIEFAKSLTRMTSTLLDTPWKVDHLGQYNGPWEGKQKVFISAGGKERIERWVGEVHQSHYWRSLKKTIWL